VPLTQAAADQGVTRAGSRDRAPAEYVAAHRSPERERGGAREFVEVLTAGWKSEPSVRSWAAA
jgi:hypothetical protein